MSIEFVIKIDILNLKYIIMSKFLMTFFLFIVYSKKNIFENKEKSWGKTW